MLIERTSMASTATLTRPFLTLTLYRVTRSNEHVMEEPQDVVEPCVVRPDYLWWGSAVHLQVV
jgi:hypothetical protein